MGESISHDLFHRRLKHIYLGNELKNNNANTLVIILLRVAIVKLSSLFEAAHYWLAKISFIF